VLSAPRTYWILDHGDGYDYDWFIVADPSMKTLSIFTRAPEPTAGTVKALTARAEALGYDTDKLEYPAEFAPGAGQAPPDGFHR
jgi:apolipoprotein D and lipocalin family protein